jgi:hypothetical protein
LPVLRRAAPGNKGLLVGKRGEGANLRSTCWARCCDRRRRDCRSCLASPRRPCRCPSCPSRCCRPCRPNRRRSCRRHCFRRRSWSCVSGLRARSCGSQTGGIRTVQLPLQPIAAWMVPLSALSGHSARGTGCSGRGTVRGPWNAAGWGVRPKMPRMLVRRPIMLNHTKISTILIRGFGPPS